MIQEESDELCHHKFASDSTPVTNVEQIKDQINILSFNERSLRCKINELRCLVLTENIDVITVTKAFIDTVNNDMLYE